MESKSYHVALSMVSGMTPRWLQAMLKAFGSPKNAWQAGEHDLQAAGIPNKVVSDLVNRRNRLKPAEELERLKAQGIQVVSVNEQEYPAGLRHIYDPPQILYMKGHPEVLNKPMMAVVGARKATHYGLAVTEQIAGELALAGLCIVSGMARGIDTAAHRGALAAGRPTVAVLGCGVDIVYPRENKKIMAEIIDNGAVISEFPPGMNPLPHNFPQRNRLISGLARGVLVVEAAERSGSLITADFALEQGRDVFAVPGMITNRLNKGAHRLIKQGARLVEDSGDILEELGYERVLPEANGQKENLTGSEKRIYNIISDDPVGTDLIIDKSGLAASEVLSLLLVMEMKGLVRQLTGQRFVRCL